MRSPSLEFRLPSVATGMALVLSVGLVGCAADLGPLTNSNANNTTAAQQAQIAASLKGTSVTFNISDYYSLQSPYASSGCAGDAKNYFDYLTDAPLASNVLDSSMTIRPSFIKNISVDITDSNSTSATNLAFGCSYGTGINVPPPSNCATFDYGALGGISANLGGSIFMFGGYSTPNYMSFNTSSSTLPFKGPALSCGTVAPSSPYINTCSPYSYALGVDVLPASAAYVGSTLTPGLSSATGPISSWSLLSGGSSSSGPPAVVGASIALNSGIQKISMFGGVSPLTTLASETIGSNTYDTWIYDLASQKWTQVAANIVIPTDQQYMNDLDYTNSNTQRTLTKRSLGRAGFGMLAIPGVAVNQLSTDGMVITSPATQVDTTDRIYVIGGASNVNNQYYSDTHRYNPTWGPEYLDFYNAPSPAYSLSTGTKPTAATLLANYPVQALDSYFVQLVSNSNPNSNYLGTNFPPPSPSPSPSATPFSINFGAATVVNYSTQYPIDSSTTTKTVGTGYPLVAGGFGVLPSTTSVINTPNSSGNCTDVNSCGSLTLGTKWGDETYTSNLTSVANQLDPLGGQENTPIQWVAYSQSRDATPWYGGGVLLNGINMSGSLSNEVAFFGGTVCRNYLTDLNCSNPPISGLAGNPGAYWSFTNNPVSKVGPSPLSNPTSYTMGPTPATATLPPKNAGMAAARGFDDSNKNPIIVAYGGMTTNQTPNHADISGSVYYLFNNNNVPTWMVGTVSSGATPGGLVNGSMVYSHVTGKFYLYGGYTPGSANTLGASTSTLWELSVSSSGMGTGLTCGKTSSTTTTPNCVFSWRLLDASAGLTCYPSCPPARRSHRMVEANYHHFVLSSDPTNSEPNCGSSAHPCSFGIFMEGGTTDGTQSGIMQDRWMLDPTANGGAGHWQLMGEMPPRSLAAMTALSYTIPIQARPAHKAILFGGETGMENPNQALTSNYFVPPTLGDTWMYDYDASTWSRVSLYGKRYDPTVTPGTFSNLSSADVRSASYVSNPRTQVLTPPPLAGAMMVTRTLSKPGHSANETGKPLLIPEVFLIGGRTKDGRFNLLNHVYKFCSGSTGEKPFPQTISGQPIPSLDDDATCDAYDPNLNPSSPSPVASAVGAWLFKQPPLPIDPSDGTTILNNASSYLGAATYDSLHDRIIVYGGIQPSTAQAAVTDQTWSSAGPSKYVYEYTPPSGTSTNAAAYGLWAAVPPCPGSLVPSSRYGHTLAFDESHNNLIAVGGYGLSSGALLTQTYNATSYVLPEVWRAKRDDTNTCYQWTQVNLFGNSASNRPLAFPTTGLAHLAGLYVPSTGYNTGFYSTFSSACTNEGPIASSDPTISRLMAGGVYIDLDRTQLGVNENLLLNLTMISLGESNTKPDRSSLIPADEAVFRIHLVRTGQTGDQIRQVYQPRYLTYAGNSQFPEIVMNLSSISPPVGQVKQEQVYIPLSIDPSIDRIRIERYSGNAILIDASIIRLGQH